MLQIAVVITDVKKEKKFSVYPLFHTIRGGCEILSH